MPKLNEPSGRSPKSGEDPSDDGSPKPSSLDRLTKFTERILKVPKSEVAKAEERNRQQAP
jgi:hypothetical protein